MQLYIIRHTRVSVPQGSCYGHTDVALADTFPQESKAILENLKGLHFDKVYSSPLTRCKKLVQIICPKRADIAYDNRLKELNFGTWEGKNWKDIEQSPQAKFWFADYIHHATPHGESYVDLLKRTQSFLAQLKKEANSGNMLIVTHGGVVRAIHTIVNKSDIRKAFELNVNYGEVIKLDL